jgi:DNA-binding LytR/AlgR family response regulator
MKIVICEDNREICCQLREICVNILRRLRVKSSVEVFYDGADLLAAKSVPDILFLDMIMPKYGGLATAKKIKSVSQDVIIIFLTGRAEFMQEAFKVKASRYLLKPVDKTQVEEALVSAVNEILSGITILADDNKRELLVKTSSIIRVESMGDGSALQIAERGATQTIQSRKTLKYWKETLNSTNFFQVHKSHIVSFNYIKSVGKSEITLTNGGTVPLAKRVAKDFYAALNCYVKLAAR